MSDERLRLETYLPGRGYPAINFSRQWLPYVCSMRISMVAVGGWCEDQVDSQCNVSGVMPEAEQFLHNKWWIRMLTERACHRKPVKVPTPECLVFCTGL